jgi:energy-coupling factor transport system substrate-specific component
VLIFFGVAFGPWVGLIAGLVGNTLGDGLSGWGFFWNWSVGNALMGMIPGLAMGMIKNYRAGKDILLGVGWGAGGIVAGMLFASLTEMFVGGIDLNTALIGYFTPATIGNVVVTVVLLPILMVAYAAVSAGRGR